MKLWGGRFEEGPSEVFERFSGSLHFDKRLIQADIRGSQAFARAQEQVRILTADQRARLASAFHALAEEAKQPGFVEGAPGQLASDEGGHPLVIRKVGEKVGKLSEKIHA